MRLSPDGRRVRYPEQDLLREREDDVKRPEQQNNGQGSGGNTNGPNDNVKQPVSALKEEIVPTVRNVLRCEGVVIDRSSLLSTPACLLDTVLVWEAILVINMRREVIL